MYEIHSYVQIYIILYTYVNCVVVFWLLCCQHARPPLQRLAFAERLTISWTQKTGADRMTEVGRNGMVPTRWGFLVVRWLTGAFYAGNGWEWRLLGWLLIVIVDHSRKFPAFSTSKMKPVLIFNIFWRLLTLFPFWGLIKSCTSPPIEDLNVNGFRCPWVCEAEKHVWLSDCVFVVRLVQVAETQIDMDP